MAHEELSEAVAALAAGASVEINVQDVQHLAAAREFLPPRTMLYVSHLPKQTWEETRAACVAVLSAGFEPIPHVPVRLVTDPAELDRLLGALSAIGVRQILLIAGDYPSARGPYSMVADVLRDDALTRYGFGRVSLAGHPEGHPHVPLAEIRRAEREKVSIAQSKAIDCTLLTQFFFEAAPFLEWSEQLRAGGVRARVVAGVVGPAKVATLFKYALRCGVGPSMRALNARPDSVRRLVSLHGPEQVLSALAKARIENRAAVDGIHLFCFGGFLRTCEWLRTVAENGLGAE